MSSVRLIIFLIGIQLPIVGSANLFNSYTKDSIHFAELIQSVQRDNYRKEKWESFFAMAQYYRQLIFQKINTHYLEDAVLLEILALSKFCQFEMALKVINEMKEYAREGTYDISKLDEMKGKILAMQEFKDLNQDQRLLNLPNIQEFKFYVVPESNNQKITSIEDPTRLKVKLDNLCQR
jgi:hypothetical protein